jgi:hypothetical protein
MRAYAFAGIGASFRAEAGQNQARSSQTSGFSRGVSDVLSLQHPWCPGIVWHAPWMPASERGLCLTYSSAGNMTMRRDSAL